MPTRRTVQQKPDLIDQSFAEQMESATPINAQAFASSDELDDLPLGDNEPKAQKQGELSQRDVEKINEFMTVIGEREIKEKNKETGVWEKVKKPYTAANALYDELGINLFGENGIVKKAVNGDQGAVKVVKALAYGSWTGPVNIKVKVGGAHLAQDSYLRTLANLRVYHFVDEKTKEFKFGYESHHVALTNKLDAEGKALFNEKGEPLLAYDRNPIREGETLYFMGKELPFDVVDHLRLTGNGGKAVKVFGEDTLLSTDMYNNHEIMTMKVSQVEKFLTKQNEFKYKDKEGVAHTVKLDERMKTALAMGGCAWGSDDAGNNVTIQYNAAFGKLTRAVDYDKLKKQEIRERNGQSQSKNSKIVEAPRQNHGPKMG